MSSAGMLARDLGIAALSVRLSVTSWYRVKTNAAWIMLFSLPGSQPKNSSFFLDKPSYLSSQGSTPDEGFKPGLEKT